MSEKVKTGDHVLMLRDVRIAFPVLWTPQQVESGKGKAAFSASFLMPPDHPVIPDVKSAIQKVAHAKWGDRAAEILKGLIAADKVCLHNGDTKSQYDGFPGNMFVSARGYVRPLVLGQDKSPVAEEDGIIYSGCFVNAQVALWAQDNNYGKRVNAGLRGVQFLRDGEAFGGGAVATPDEFDYVEGEDADGEEPEGVDDLVNW